MNESLPGALAFLMHRRGISQAELARRTDMPKGQISRYVSGAVTPQLLQLDRLLAGLEVEPVLFFLVAEKVRELGLLTEHRASGRRLRGGDPVFAALLHAALGDPAASATDGNAEEGNAEDGIAEEAGGDPTGLRTLLQAQKLALESQRLFLEYLDLQH
jgi:transcriptional regulator with XRE-family HTH domain